MRKHTPGPWTWDGYELWHIGKGYMPDEKRDPHLYTGILQDRGLSHSETLQANARLIAAAPEMLEALENIENDDAHIPATIWDLIQKAIAKAKGGE